MDLSGFPNTEAEFRAQFADDNRCREYLARLKWPEGFRCAHCAGDRAVVYECAGCGRQVSVIAGTVFEQSKKPLVLWFRALFEITVRNPANRVGPPRIKPSSPPRWRSVARAVGGFASV